MAREKKTHRIELTEGKRNIIQQLLQEYQIETAEDIQDALKDLLGGTIKEMMEVETDDCCCSPFLSLPCPRHLPKTAPMFCRITA